MKRSTMAVLAMLLALVLAACGGGEAATEEAEATATPTAEETAEATPDETDDDEESPDETDGEAGAEPSIDFDDLGFDADEELEELLPDEIDGVELEKFSFAGEEFADSADDEFNQLLVRLGATPDDVSFAVAFDPAGNLEVQIGAFRIEGADGNRIRDEFRASIEEESDVPVDIRQENIGGKDVLTGTDPDGNGELYFYVRADILFFVTSPDADLAEEALSELP